MNYDIFCDESGNTGTNYLDPNQPLYVLSGWMVERNLSYRAKNRVQDLKEKNFPQAQELKGSKLLKSSKGKSFCSNLIFGEMGDAHCIPFFIIAEKRYAVAAKMVESFLDSEYNERINTAFSWMNAQKKQIAEIIYDVSDGSIEKYAEAHKRPEFSTIKESYLLLLNELEENGYKDLVYAVEGVKDNLHEVLDEETHTLQAVEKNAMHTLNYPVFVSFIQLIEKFSRTTNFKKVRMFHDEVAQFEKAYPEIFSLYSNSKSQEEFILENGASILFSTDKIKTFQMEDSKRSLMIQAADVLSSTLNYHFTKLYNDEEVEQELAGITDFLLGSFMVNDEFYEAGFCDYIGSTKLFKKLFREKGFISNKEVEEKSHINIKPYLYT